MISVAETVVDEWTGVIIVLDTFVTYGAMEGCLGLDYFTIRTKVVQVKTNVQSNLNKLGVVINRHQISWLQSH